MNGQDGWVDWMVLYTLCINKYMYVHILCVFYYAYIYIYFQYNTVYKEALEGLINDSLHHFQVLSLFLIQRYMYVCISLPNSWTLMKNSRQYYV